MAGPSLIGHASTGGSDRALKILQFVPKGLTFAKVLGEVELAEVQATAKRREPDQPDQVVLDLYLRARAIAASR